jgi:DNA invertase Pin-like site-specific DNA recombinase
MTGSKLQTKRCAIYTRKSSEEGLDQDFNSLDAQCEACAAYIASQRAEGWKGLPTTYNDGGFSGGSMDRPALQRLLTDIQANKIDVIVVYKIDRLTRSLTDFARMVELFERHQVSFVSVTQAFNTTTSMGRLTLNVLLSFAQFEREVTGERIRDKIAASKAKGMWMGGNLPLGYDQPDSGSRTLKVNPAEAETVRRIFAAYLELGSVHALARRLREEGIHSKRYVTVRGHLRGGAYFGRGALFHLLRNQVYLGKITHRGESHPGLHPAIIDKETFEFTQAKLDAQTRRPQDPGPSQAGSKTHSPVARRIFDGDGQPMVPAFAYGRGGKLYRYYVSASLHRGGKNPSIDTLPRRVAATAIEAYLTTSLAKLLPVPASKPQPDACLALISRVEVHADHLTVTLPARLWPAVEAKLSSGVTITPDHDDPTKFRLTLPFRVSTQRGRTELVAGDQSGPSPNPTLNRALRQAYALLGRHDAGASSIMTVPTSTYQRRLLCLAFLAPDIQEAILTGRQPLGLTLNDLMDRNLPPVWPNQRKTLGFPPVG